jgi:hypothetical protein
MFVELFFRVKIAPFWLEAVSSISRGVPESLAECHVSVQMLVFVGFVVASSNWFWLWCIF